MNFRTSVKLTLLLLLLATLFGRLGYWQLERRSEKQALFDRYERAPMMTLDEALAAGVRFAHVEVAGHFDTERHVLLDNRILDGRAGVHVLTPFLAKDGHAILVNRGWLPLAPDRRALPDVPTNGRDRVLRGRLNLLESGGPKLGDATEVKRDTWPQLVTWLEREQLADVLSLELEPWQLLMDPLEPDGFGGREWKPATMEPEVHGAYAVQWFGLMAAAIVIWIVLGFREGSRRKTTGTEHSEYS